MVIYDSVLRKKVKFEPLEKNIAKIYLCGPTTYDHAHLGHAKSSISFDLLRRVLTKLGFEVKFARNFTDIDDKILKKMEETSKSLEEITEFYIKSYQDDMKALNILEPDFMPKATLSLKAIISYIQNLLNLKFAYILQDGIYFDTSKDEKYLSLSQRIDENKQARVSSNDEKKDEKDFVLWKFDEAWYDAPFGKGRPGWHTECVAMIDEIFSSSVDIHAGGLDLLFPHHENEAAQCRCAKNKPLAKFWMHNGFIQVDNEKMSKSLGNSFFVKDALNLVGGEVLRFYLLSTHYRSNFNYNLDDLKASKKRLDKIYRLKKRLLGTTKSAPNSKFVSQILEFLQDDLNISGALSVVDEMVNLANESLDKEPKNKNLKSEILANLDYTSEILGILQTDSIEYFQFGLSQDEKNKINDLINQRNLAKKERNFALADEIRDNLAKMQISIMDTPNGTIWEKL